MVTVLVVVVQDDNLVQQLAMVEDIYLSHVLRHALRKPPKPIKYSSTIRRKHLNRRIIPVDVLISCRNRLKRINGLRITLHWRICIFRSEALIRKFRGTLRRWCARAGIYWVILIMLTEFRDSWYDFDVRSSFIEGGGNIHDFCSGPRNLGNWGARHSPVANTSSLFVGDRWCRRVSI